MEVRSLRSCSEPPNGSVSLARTQDKVLTSTSYRIPTPCYFSNLISDHAPSLTLLQPPRPSGCSASRSSMPSSRHLSLLFLLLKRLFSQVTHFNLGDSNLLCSFYLMKLYLPQYSSSPVPIFPYSTY